MTSVDTGYFSSSKALAGGPAELSAYAAKVAQQRNQEQNVEAVEQDKQAKREETRQRGLTI